MLLQVPNPAGRRNNNSRNRVSTKSLSAYTPCAGPSLNSTRPGPRSPYENPIPFPKGHPKCPWGWAPQPPTEMSPAECHAESARLKNAKIKKKWPAPLCTMRNVERQQVCAQRQRRQRMFSRDMQYHWQVKNNAWEILLCWGPWYHEQ